MCVRLLRCAVRCPWEAHRGQSLQQEEGCDVHHHHRAVPIQRWVSDGGTGRLNKSSLRSFHSRSRLVGDSIPVFRFLGSLRARLKQLHPSANCSLRDDHMVHVHFKEEIGIAELIPLVTTYIILFAYIYFSTRECGRALCVSLISAGLTPAPFLWCARVHVCQGCSCLRDNPPAGTRHAAVRRPSAPRHCKHGGAH